MIKEYPEEKADDSQPSELPSDTIPEKQWELPVGFDGGSGETVTLRELVKNTPRLVPRTELTEAQCVGLVAQRIQAQGKLDLAMFGVDGIIDKERAVREVQQGSRVGKTITQVELLMIEDMISLAKGETGSE